MTGKTIRKTQAPVVHGIINDEANFQDLFEVLTAVSTKMAVFWVVAPCSLVEVYQRFIGPCCLHHQGESPSETLVNLYQTTRRYNPENSHLQGNFRLLTTFINGMQRVVGRELRFRMPRTLDEALQIANTVYNAVKLERSWKDQIFSVSEETTASKRIT
jgi:hypothetical protein